MKPVVAALVSLCLLLGAPVCAEEDAGTSSPFALGAGGRIIGMGGAAAAVWGGSYALLWNPAGLNRVERIEVDAFHTTLFDDDVTYSSVLASYPFLDFGVISFGVLQLRVGGIERRDAENRIVGEIANTQTRYVLGYARGIYGGLTAGLNLKLDRFVLDSYQANGFGIDAGAGFESAVGSTLIDGMALGCSVVNVIEPRINLVGEEAGDPRGIRIGFAVWRSVSRSLEDRLSVALDFEKTRFSDTHSHFGAEYRLYDRFAVRGGWDAGVPTFGCGITLHSFLFDYAYRSTDLGGNHLFSLAFRFGSSRSERLRERLERRANEIREELDAEMDRIEQRFISDALAAGERRLGEGRHEEAIEQFQRVLLWAPNDDAALRGMETTRAALLSAVGDSLAREARYAEALLSYREAHKFRPTPDIERGIELCERNIERAADRNRMIDGLLTQSIELFTDHEWAGALRGFEKILDLDPGNELARNYLEKTRARNVEEHDRLLSRARRSADAGDYGEALVMLRAALETYPGDAAIAEAIERVTALRGDAEAAQRARREELQREAPVPPEEIDELRSRYEKGIEAFKRNDFPTAIEQWEIVWSRYPQFEEVEEYLIKAYQYRGMNLYSKNRYREALEVWGKILEVDRNNEKALRYIKRTKEELEKFEGFTG